MGTVGPDEGLSPDALLGRDRELSLLQRAVAAAADGTGGCVILEGPAGIGKTRLLNTAVHSGRSRDLAIAVGTATKLDRVAPLSTLVTTFGTAGLELAAVTSGNPVRMVYQLVEVLQDFARERPLLVAMDDAHQADELTALGLRVLIPALASTPVLWLLSRRHGLVRKETQEPTPANDAIDYLNDWGATNVTIGPLPERAVLQLCVKSLGAAPDDQVLAEAHRCGGNPFLIGELLDGLCAAGQVLVEDGVARMVSGGLPADFLNSVSHRLRELTGHALRVLDAGSVLGRPFTVHEAAGMVGLSAVELIPAITEAVDAGALVDLGTQVAFRHEIIRDAVYDALIGPVRQALHAAAADVVRIEGRSPVETAEHLIRSGQVAEPGASGVIRDAVTRLGPTAPDTALDLALRTVALLDANHPVRPILVSEAIYLMSAGGRVTEAEELGEKVLREDAVCDAQPAILLGLAEALVCTGRSNPAVQYIRRGLARPVTEPVRARLLAVQAHALLAQDKPVEAARAGAEADAVRRGTSDRNAHVATAIARSAVAYHRGLIDEAIGHAEEAVTVADAGGQARRRQPRLWLADALVAADRFADAAATLEVSRTEARELGTSSAQPLWHLHQAELALATGDLAASVEDTDAGLRAAEQFGVLWPRTCLLALRCHLALLLGDLGVARGHLDQVKQAAEDGVSLPPEDLLWRVVLLMDRTGGDARAALRAVESLCESLPDRPRLLVREPRAAARLVRIAQRRGAGNLAEAAAHAAHTLAKQNPVVPSMQAGAEHANGLLHNDIEALSRAIDGYAGRPLDRAAAAEDAARAHRQAGNQDIAVGLLTQSLDTYARCGASWDADRVARAVRRLGGRASAPKPRSSAQNLTPSEKRVVRLVTQGLTNRQIARRLSISPHTVDSHVRHSFAKLGVNSRVELTRLVVATSQPD